METRKLNQCKPCTLLLQPFASCGTCFRSLLKKCFDKEHWNLLFPTWNIYYFVILCKYCMKFVFTPFDSNNTCEIVVTTYRHATCVKLIFTYLSLMRLKMFMWNNCSNMVQTEILIQTAWPRNWPKIKSYKMDNLGVYWTFLKTRNVLF